MIIPFTILLISNLLITLKLTKKFNKRDMEQDQNSERLIKKGRLSYLLKSFKESDAFSNDLTNENNVLARRHTNINNNEAIKILFLITTSFLILNLPLALIKTYQYLNQNYTPKLMIDRIDDFTSSNNSWDNNLFILNDSNIEELLEHENYSLELEEILKYSIKIQKQEIVWKICFLIYYLNFSINFFLYSYKKRYFNEILVDLFRKFFYKIKCSRDIFK